MSELDLRQFPLSGRQLIEASAGTGKTYSITALYLRALLGHGMTAAVPLAGLLVVTFTIASTDELRGRVRARLLQMRERLRTGAPDEDQFNETLAAAMTAHESALALRTLDVALQSLDSAAIYTIHGFCLRVLREFAFDSGVAFEQELIMDDGDYLQAAVVDAWRRLVYQSNAEVAARLSDLWPQPTKLWGDVKDVLRRNDLQLLGADVDTTAAASALLDDAIIAFKAAAKAVGLADALAFSNLSRDAKKGLTAKPRIDALRALLELPGTEGTGPDDEPLVNFLARYTTVGFAAADRLQRGQAFDASVVAAAADRVAHLQQQLRACALREVILTARAQAQQEKIRRGVLSADDVLNRTLAALTGAQGAAFARRLRQRFPVAMIDEFQDTDPVQWQIFARVYDTASSDAFACVLIGDPKQAIYGFRGADVFSYLDARQIIGAPRLHRLNVTRRASARLANGLNALYWNAERSPFLLNGIDYLPIASAITNENAGFSRDGVDLPPLIFWHLDLQHRDAVGKGDMVEAMADVAAARIEAMLKGPYRVDGVALVPGDIAVLVRDRTEAGPMRRALARRRRDAAYLDRSGVFAGEAAQLVRLLLLALADPNDDARVRAVLASHLGGWSIARLAESLTDDDAWQQETERFHELAAVAAARGVLAMLRAAIARFDLAPRWLNTANGARLLTDWRHVGELLQIEAARLGGGARLIRWLERRMAAASSDEAHLMRLESDEDLIKIVTLHGAKGLEYPVVLLPFVCAARRNTGGIYHTLVDEADTGSRDAGAAQQSARRPADPLAAPRHRAVWDLRAEPHAEIDQERLAEDLRLLYVGLTRARRACFVGVANSDREPVSYSALGRLLLGDDTGAGDAQLQAALAKLSAACPDIAVESVTAEAVAPATAAVAVDAPVSADAPPFEDPRGSTLTADDTPAARTFTGRIDASWRITSYSSLTRAASAEYTAPGADDEDAGEHTAVVDAEAAIQYQFPRGAAAGVVLHKLLERWPSDDPLPFVTTELRNAGLLYGRKSLGESARDELRARAVVAWLNTVRAVKLAPLNVALRDLTRVRAELEFQLPLANVPTRQLWRVLATHGYRGDALPAQQLNGMLRGFIDLVFEHQGRYFIVDYKSNFLGGQAQAYSARHLAAAMRNHRYDLQFLLYALALRRWLALHAAADGSSAPATPEVFYLFLRGVAAPGAGIFRHAPTAAVLDELDALFAGSPPKQTAGVAASPLAGVRV